MDSTQKTLHVLFVAAEADPLIKVGGLGDVTGSLPRALLALEADETIGYHLDIRLVLPFHPVMTDRIKVEEPVTTFQVPHPGGSIPAWVYLTQVENLPVYLIAGDPIGQDCQVYCGDIRKDGQKYTFFSLAVLEMVRALNWVPDILHAHDWHTATSVYRLFRSRAEEPVFASTKTVLTVHNLPFMGLGVEEALASFGIPPLDEPDLPPWGTYQPLPMGLATADHITTVSPTYAREILTSEYGSGMQDFLRLRAGSISGIINGLDETTWDPYTDSALAAPFNLQTLKNRRANKLALLHEVGLPADPDSPLITFLNRLVYQKGVDLALEGLRQVADLPWRAIFLGTGEPGLEAAARQFEAEFPSRVRAVIRFDAQLARRIYAGGDFILMPSRYEPCGLVQMIAMRYGCIPVARATGGLKDTVLDCENPAQSTGFLFEQATPEAMADAIRRAIEAYHHLERWQARQKLAMQQDFSWRRSARAYLQIYHQLQSKPGID